MKYQFLEHTPSPSSFAARPPLPPELPAEVLGVVAIPLGPHGEYEALSLAGTSQFGIAKLVDITALSSLGLCLWGYIYIWYNYSVYRVYKRLITNLMLLILHIYSSWGGIKQQAWQGGHQKCCTDWVWVGQGVCYWDQKERNHISEFMFFCKNGR